MNADNLNNVRHEISRHTSKKLEIFKDKIMKQTVETKMLEFVGTYINLIRNMNLELNW